MNYLDKEREIKTIMEDIFKYQLNILRTSKEGMELEESKQVKLAATITVNLIRVMVNENFKELSKAED